MEILVAIDALDGLVHQAKRRPLRRSEVLLDRETYAAGLARMRAAIATYLPDVVAPAVAEPIGALERMAAESRVRGERISLDAEAVYDELDRARAVVVDDVRRQRDR